MPTRTKDQIINDVKDQLVWDAQVDSTDITVSANAAGQVTLEGTVPSFSAKRAAEADAWSVWGVTAVDNQLAVSYPATGGVLTDTEIESSVANVLLWNPAIDSTDINVSAEAGVVTLEGTVDSFWKKVRAEELTSDVIGVLNVVNQLAVVPTEDFIDKDIATDVVDSLKRKVAVNPEDVNVRVSNGVVTISGSVPSFNAWSAAYDSARYTAGVVDVVDQLTITSS